MSFFRHTGARFVYGAWIYEHCSKKGWEPVVPPRLRGLIDFPKRYATQYGAAKAAKELLRLDPKNLVLRPKTL